MSLLNRVRRRAVSAGQAGVEPHSWALPSSYSSPKSGDAQTIVPNPKIFANAHIPGHIDYNTKKNPLVYPDVSHAAVHLALLECFRNLRTNAHVDLEDGELESPPVYTESPEVTPIESPQDEVSPEDQKWNNLVKLAVTRFEAWWSNIDRVLNHASVYVMRSNERIGVQLTKDYLPPLDVLLVWYAFMLDTRAYRLECCDLERYSPRVRQLCFPWTAIRDILDMDNLHYDLPQSAKILFNTLTGRSAEISTYVEEPPAYTDTKPMEFDIDLFQAVKKHEGFIEQAHKLLWIRSPSLYTSLERSSVSYFATQLQRKAGIARSVSVPFGIDLLWRTHRLYSDQYDCFLRVTGDFPASSGDDTDQSAESAASSASLDCCFCWTCERIRDVVPSFAHSPCVTSSSGSQSLAPPSDGSYIPSEAQLVGLTTSQRRQIMDDLGFHKAVEKARQYGKPLPIRSTRQSKNEAEKAEQDKQIEFGSMAGLSEYFEKSEDGSYKVRKGLYGPVLDGLPVP